MEGFVYSVSHDLRAPLRHVDGYVELLRRRVAVSGDAEARRCMDLIGRSARRMGDLMDDLLAFARMGRADLSRHPVDLGLLAREVVSELGQEAARVRWQIHPLPTVVGDGAMLRIVLANLLSNAVKFTRPCGEPRVSIGTSPSADGEVVVFVRDNGVGFDGAYAGKLFGVFQRLHRAEDFEGTGIGLATVRRIVARFGGRTWAEGSLGGGASFYFSLPCREPTGDPASIAPRAGGRDPEQPAA
jgi:light-regulated signal transduction histidine kinase (bacteriophytochrome)